MRRKVVIDGMSTADTTRQHMIGLPPSQELTWRLLTKLSGKGKLACPLRIQKKAREFAFARLQRPLRQRVYNHRRTRDLYDSYSEPNFRLRYASSRDMTPQDNRTPASTAKPKNHKLLLQIPTPTNNMSIAT